MGSVAAAGGSFDASKSGMVPQNALHNAPRDEPAVYVAFVNPDIGYGVFAARGFEAGEFIFHEAPLIEPTDFCQLRVQNDISHAPTQMQRLADKLVYTDNDSHIRMRFAFPKLAAQMGQTLPTYDHVIQFMLTESLGSNLKHGQLSIAPEQVVTRDEYDKYIQRVQTEVAAHGGGPLATIDERTKMSADFFRGYAFQVRDTVNPRNHDPRATRKATIYLLASLVNHCCTPRRRLRRRTADGDNVNAGANVRPGGNNHVDETTVVVVDKNVAQEQNDNDGSNSNTSDEEEPESEPSQPDATPSNGRRRRPGPNCEWRIGPSGLAKFIKQHHIAVQAKRAIKAGEELTWDYGKRDHKFVCLCATCESRPNRSCCVL